MHKLWLFLILSLAIFLRFYALTSSPPALNWDEVSIGYNAYSILKTGKDEWGEFLPLSFTAFGEHKLPGMIYASVPGIALFGTTDLGVRVTPALLGVLAVILIYLLAAKLFNNRTFALSAAFLMAVSPWAVHFSRVSFEAGLALVLLLSSLYFLLDAANQPKRLWYSLILAVLAIYTYNSVRIFLPLILLAYLWNRTIPWSTLKPSRLIPLLLVGILLLSPVILNLSQKESLVRWNALSITAQKSFTDNIAESRGYTNLPSPLPRLIHNKLTHYAYEVFHNYLQVFSTDFLLFRGGENTQRSVQGMGLLYLFELPLLIVGLITLLKQSQSNPKLLKIIVPWLLLSPIPSIITTDSPSTVRALNLLPALILVESLGVAPTLAWLKQRSWLKLSMLLFVIWNISYFAYQLFMVYPQKYGDDWQYGYKQAVEYASSNYDQVDKIFFTAKFGEPHIFVLFYTGFDPATYHLLEIEKSQDPLGWYHVNAFDKYVFTNFAGLQTPQELVARNSGNLLMVTGFAQLPSEFERTLEIKAPNWQVMFEGTIQEGAQ